MTKRVLDVGNCVPDHASIRHFIHGNFSADVDQTHGPSDTLDALRNQSYDLVLINRKLDQDYSDGMEIVRQIKTDPALSSVPVMLVTNFAEHQQAAVAAGAEYGFGKLELAAKETVERVRAILG